ncbi:hypothetical protein MY4824_001108 [Beauveria thailandica]
MKDPRERAKALNLFNLFLPDIFGVDSLARRTSSTAACAEIMGCCYSATWPMNCHAPETGNIELLAKYYSAEQKEKWPGLLLEGIKSST